MRARILKLGPPYYKYTLFMVEFFGGKYKFQRRYYISREIAERAIEHFKRGESI